MAAPAAASKSVPAVKRAAAILSLLANEGRAMTLSQIAHAVDVLPGSCLQILRELAQVRLLAFDPAHKTYRLGPGLVDLARAVMRQDPFAESAQPYLKEIAEAYGMTAFATAATDEDHFACVALAQPPVSMSLNVTLGGRVPLLSGAAGRCFAAFGAYPKARLRRSFAKVRWEIPMSFEQWLADVEDVQRLGYSEDAGAFARGVTTIAVPVFAHDDSVRGSIGVGVISAQLDGRLKTRLIQHLKKAARGIGAQLWT
jgi:DNA-binding IclR family transcriptional regulator